MSQIKCTKNSYNQRKKRFKLKLINFQPKIYKTNFIMNKEENTNELEYTEF